MPLSLPANACHNRLLQFIQSFIHRCVFNLNVSSSIKIFNTYWVRNLFPNHKIKCSVDIASPDVRYRKYLQMLQFSINVLCPFVRSTTLYSSISVCVSKLEECAAFPHSPQNEGCVEVLGMWLLVVYDRFLLFGSTFL